MINFKIKTEMIKVLHHFCFYFKTKFIDQIQTIFNEWIIILRFNYLYNYEFKIKS